MSHRPSSTSEVRQNVPVGLVGGLARLTVSVPGNRSATFQLAADRRFRAARFAARLDTRDERPRARELCDRRGEFLDVPRPFKQPGWHTTTRSRTASTTLGRL